MRPRSSTTETRENEFQRSNTGGNGICLAELIQNGETPYRSVATPAHTTVALMTTTDTAAVQRRAPPLSQARSRAAVAVIVPHTNAADTPSTNFSVTNRPRQPSAAPTRSTA